MENNQKTEDKSELICIQIQPSPLALVDVQRSIARGAIRRLSRFFYFGTEEIVSPLSVQIFHRRRLPNFNA